MPPVRARHNGKDMMECIKNWNPFPWLDGHCVCECEKCKGERMTKYYCDICGEEIEDYNRINGIRLHGEYSSLESKLMFDITTGFAGTWNAGIFCKYCIIDAVNTLDDRQ